MGKNGDGKRIPERGWGFYTGFLVLGARCTRRAELDVEGGVSGRHCGPSLGVGLAVSVAQRSGRGGLGFRLGVTKTGLPWVGTLGQGARRWWPGVDGTVPCRFGCRATRVCPRACWNAMPALGAPGGSLTSVGTVGVASHGRPKVKPSRGIDPRCRGGVWWRGDRAGGGWWLVDQTRMPTVAMATARATWGGWARSLPCGVGVGCLQGGVLPLGVDGGG
jgi:hypothetical protein